jgi:hypothetical protein
MSKFGQENIINSGGMGGGERDFLNKMMDNDSLVASP